MTLAVELAVAVAGAEMVRMLCPVVMVSITGKVKVTVAGVESATLVPVAVAFCDSVIV
jgi:hypothetical protein